MFLTPRATINAPSHRLETTSFNRGPFADDPKTIAAMVGYEAVAVGTIGLGAMNAKAGGPKAVSIAFAFGTALAGLGRLKANDRRRGISR